MHVRALVELDAKAPDGSTNRATWEAAAAKGNAEAAAKLAIPECPVAFAHLLPIGFALHGRSGATQFGLAPLSPTTIRHWRQERGLPRFEPEEIDALLAIDAALTSLPTPSAAPVPPPALEQPRAVKSWPKKKPPQEME